MSIRRAFTLVELLVSIAIIGVLMALLLVAVQQARESSRRSACTNNLRQLGIAFQSYHDNLGTLPAAVIWSPAGEPLGGGYLPIGVIDRVARQGATNQDTIYANWAIMLLPHLEQAALYQQFNPNLPISHAVNAKVREQTLPVFSCPSDAYSDPGNPFLRGLAAGLKDNRYARGNYGLNCGPDEGCVMPGTKDLPCAQGFFVRDKDLLAVNDQAWGSGLGGTNKSFRLSEITDGLSQTVIVDEIRAGIDPLDPRGVWALGQIGSSGACRHGVFEGLSGPNPTGDKGDVLMGCGALATKLGGPVGGDMPCMGGDINGEINAIAGARSLHPGGVNTLNCDGSVHFTINTIDAAVWQALHTRSGGENAAVAF